MMGMMARMIVPLVDDRLVVVSLFHRFCGDTDCFVEMKRTEERPRLCK